MNIKDITLNKYQEAALKTAIFPANKALEYCTIALAGETGEVCEKVKRILRGDKTFLEQREAIALELGDVCWYIANLAHHIGYTLEDIARMNLKKLSARQGKGLLKGEGDNR